MTVVKRSQARRQVTKLEKPAAMMTQGVLQTTDARAGAGVHQVHPPLKKLGQGNNLHRQAGVQVKRETLLKSRAKAEAHLQTAPVWRHEMQVQRKKVKAESREEAIAGRRKEAKVERRNKVPAVAGVKRGVLAARKREARVERRKGAKVVRGDRAVVEIEVAAARRRKEAEAERRNEVPVEKRRGAAVVRNEGVTAEIKGEAAAETGRGAIVGTKREAAVERRGEA